MFLPHGDFPMVILLKLLLLSFGNHHAEIGNSPGTPCQLAAGAPVRAASLNSASRQWTSGVKSCRPSTPSCRHSATVATVATVDTWQTVGKSVNTERWQDKEIRTEKVDEDFGNMSLDESGWTWWTWWTSGIPRNPHNPMVHHHFLTQIAISHLGTTSYEWVWIKIAQSLNHS
jgi:hypothetical protein